VKTVKNKIQCHVVKNTILQTAFFGDFSHWVGPILLFFRTGSNESMETPSATILFESTFAIG